MEAQSPNRHAPGNAAVGGANGKPAPAPAPTTTVGAATRPAGDTPRNGGNTPATPHPHDPNPNASANANAIQVLLRGFDASRNQVIATRQTLIDQLAGAKNDAERQQILAQLREEQKSMEDLQRANAKELRAELQVLRRQRAGGG